MNITGFDHIVLVVRDVPATVAFYTRVLGLEAREERPGKVSLHFGAQKISLQAAGTRPELAAGTVPGSGNFCLLTDDPVDEVADLLRTDGIEIVAGPAEKDGATGTLISIYLRDPDGNLVEIGNPLPG